MAAKTGQQVEDDVFRMVRESVLPSLISGSVYKFGMRPRDSKLEDIIVKFVTGSDEDIQTGTVVVNIYVPDFDPYEENGVVVRDITRCTELEIAANEWVDGLTAKSGYLFRRAQTIYTEEEPELKQHFVTIRLKFKIPTF